MKLVYLWVEYYEFMKRQGFLLNSGYEVKKDDEGMCWEIVKKRNLDPLLYGGNIDITAIVGDNGAGKSTLLDIIRLMLFDKRNRKKKIKGFLVWEDNDVLGMISEMDELPPVKYRGGTVDSNFLPQDFNLIYYSDFLDSKYYSEDFDDGENEPLYIEEFGEDWIRDSVQINISTSFLLRENSRNVRDYFHSDIKKQITYFNEQKEQKLLVSMPQRLFVKMEFLDINILDKRLDASLSEYNTKREFKKSGVNVDSLLIEILKKMKKEFYRNSRTGSKPRNEMDIICWNIWVTYLANLLDHFFPKSEYPMFALCFFNLIPACPACNRIKHDNLQEFASPYKDGVFHDLKISWEYEGKADDERYDEMDSLEELEKKIEIKILTPELSEQNNISGMRILEAYQQHKDYAGEVIKRVKTYSNPEAQKLISGIWEPEGISSEEITRFYFGNYLNETELKKRPLSKMTRDFLEEYKKITNLFDDWKKGIR